MPMTERKRILAIIADEQAACDEPLAAAMLQRAVNRIAETEPVDLDPNWLAVADLIDAAATDPSVTRSPDVAAALRIIANTARRRAPAAPTPASQPPPAPPA